MTYEETIVWNEFTTRPATKEEQEEYDLLDGETFYNCPLPDNGEEVLIALKNGEVEIDTFCVDVTGCWFDSFELSEVKAWASLPTGKKPYTEPTIEEVREESK